MEKVNSLDTKPYEFNSPMREIKKTSFSKYQINNKRKIDFALTDTYYRNIHSHTIVFRIDSDRNYSIIPFL